MSNTLLLFDIDGTLVNSERIILAAMAEAFAATDVPMPERAKALSIVGLSLIEAFTALVGPEGPVATLVDVYGQTFASLRTANAIPQPLFDGAEALLASVKGRPLGIATGKSRRGVTALLDKHGWHDLFSTIQTADDAPSKPHPQMIRQACAEAGIAAEHTMMIGDSSYDMAMAKAAGARALGVAWGFQPRDALIAAGTDVIAEDFDHLAVLIDQFSR